MSFHKLLQRQIKRHLPESLYQHPDLQKLFAAVSESYYACDRDKEISERAFSISEEEYIEINKKLKYEIEVKKQSVEKLKQAIDTITGEEKVTKTDDLLIIAKLLNNQVIKRKKAELVFTSLISNMHSAVLLENEHRQIAFTNQCFCDLFNIPVDPDELQGANCADSAEQSKHLFKDPCQFIKSTDELLSRQQLVTNEMLELKDGRILQRDYIPIFLENKYKGHLWSYTDITEKKKVEDAIKKSELTNRLILNAALDAIVIINQEGLVTFWNPQAEKIFGWREKEIMGKQLSQLIVPPKHRSSHDMAISNFSITSASSMLNKTVELSAINKQGHEFPVELSIIPVQHESGNFFCGFIRDISERNKTEKELKASQELWQFALEGAGDGVWQFDFLTKDILFSKQFKAMLGYDDDTFKNTTREWFSKIHEEDRQTVINTSKAYTKKQITSHQLEYRMRHKDGHYLWILDRGRLFKSDGINNERIIGTNTDITEIKQAEDEYRRMSVVASANENGVLFTDISGKISWANEGFKKMTLYAADDITGKTPIELCGGPMSDNTVMAEMVQNFWEGKSFMVELIHYRKNGTWFWGRTKGQPVMDANGKVILYFAIIEDISKEKASQKKLKEYEQRLKIALSNVGDNYWEHNFITGKTYFSNADNNILGYASDEIKDEAKLWWNSLHPEDKKILYENDKNYNAGLIDHHENEYRVFHKDGSVHWILDRGVVTEKTEAGFPLKIIGTHINITKQKELELELSRRADQFKSLSENIPGVIYEYEFCFDGTERFRYVSLAITEIFGVSPEKLKLFDRYLHPEDRKEFIEKRRQSRETLQPFYTEARLVLPRRPIIWFSVTFSFSYYTPEGNAVFTGFLLNITERKNADQALKINEEKYRNIIANMNLGLLEVDNDEIIRSCNQSFCLMSGYTKEELIGKKASNLFVTGDQQELMKSKNESRKRGVVDAYEISARNKNGQCNWWLISGAPLYNDKREIIGSIGIHLDITNKKALEQELLTSREQAQSSAKAKQAFLANMSHEIRTPMNAILGMSRQLQKTELNGDQQLYLDTINNAGEHLMVIINDILDISKIEAGKLTLEKIGFDFRDVIKNTVEVMQLKASEKGLLIKTKIDDKITAVLNGDPYRLKQILFNLLSNAIKFSEIGNVYIDCELLEQDKNLQRIQIKVTDNGIGMSEDFLKNLFQSFTQEDKSVTRKFGGTGLGMTITKQLTELMGGKVKVESEKNVGTTFILSIPFERGLPADLPATAVMDTDSSILKDKKILLVEDNQTNRLIAKITLRPYGILLTESVNGLEAVEAVAKNSFDIVLMDMQMPEMDGVEATRVIRQQLKATVPIIALTANAIKGESEKCFEAGMDDFLSKPFNENDLIAKIAWWLSKENCGDNKI